MEIDDARVRQLIDGLLKLLIRYEVNFNAYRIVLQEAEKQTRRAHLSLEFGDALEHTAQSAALYAEVEADYAEIESLLNPLSPVEFSKALDRALSAVARKTNQNK